MKVKLNPDREQRNKLLTTMEKFNEACNYTSEIAWHSKKFGKTGIQKLTYYDIRQKFGLSAQLTVRAIAKASASNNSTVTRDELDIIESHIDKVLKESIAADEIEDEQLQDFRGYDQLDETSKNRVKSVCKKHADKLNNTNQDKNLKYLNNVKVAKQESVKDDVKRFSLTDPESRFIKNKKVRIKLGYNTQITVNHKEGIILANDLYQQISDAPSLNHNLNLLKSTVED